MLVPVEYYPMSKETALTKALQMQRSLSLRLYKSILTAHRGLSPEIRFIGDAYVREEFKLHKNAKPEHLRGFFEEWITYLRTLQEMDLSSPGRDLDKDVLSKLSEDQRDKLITMFNESQNLFGTGITLEREIDHESTKIYREQLEKKDE